MHKDEDAEEEVGEKGIFPTKPINKKVGKVGEVIYIHTEDVLYIQYTEKVRKERREDNNDCDVDADKRTAAAAAAVAAHRSSSSYDIDNSPVEREAEAVFPMHILQKRVSHPALPTSPTPPAPLQEAASCRAGVSARPYL